MMSELQNHLSNLRQFGKQMKSVIQVADALDNIVSLEVYQGELEASVKSLEATKAKLSEDTTLAAASVEAAKAEAAQIVSGANQRADEITSAATAEAASAKADAQAKASTMVESAKTEAARIVDVANANAKAMRERDAALAAELSQKAAAVLNLDKEIEVREAKLAEVKKALAALAA